MGLSDHRPNTHTSASSDMSLRHFTHSTPYRDLMPQCKICSNTENNVIYTVREMMYGTGHSYEYFACSACNCLQIVTPPTNPEELYPPHYYSYRPIEKNRLSGIRGYLSNLKTRAGLSTTKTLADKFVATLLGTRQDYRILRTLQFDRTTRFMDVGGGSGQFLLPLHSSGYTRCIAIDPYIEKDLTYPGGLRVRKCTIFDIDEAFDFIFYNHSFEHILEQRRELDRVHELLTDQGKCVISVPVFPSLAWDRYGVNWYQIDAPRHIFIHSVKSMQHLAAATGFAIEQVIYNSTYAQFSISEMYQKGIYMRDQHRHLDNLLARKYRKLLHSRLAKKQNELGRGDQATFILATVAKPSAVL